MTCHGLSYSFISFISSMTYFFYKRISTHYLSFRVSSTGTKNLNWQQIKSIVPIVGIRKDAPLKNSIVSKIILCMKFVDSSLERRQYP